MEEAAPGCVGLFWVLSEHGRAVPLVHAVPCAEAVQYGGMLTVEAGHFDHWSALARRGAAKLRADGLPSAPLWSEYEEWPRGRVLYDTEAARFVIRADRWLHRAGFVAIIAEAFALGTAPRIVLADEHYRSIHRPPLPATP